MDTQSPFDRLFGRKSKVAEEAHVGLSGIDVTGSLAFIFRWKGAFERAVRSDCAQKVRYLLAVLWTSGIPEGDFGFPLFTEYDSILANERRWRNRA